MTLIITEPSAVVNDMLTKALAARTQILYLLSREDFQVVNTEASGGGLIRILITGDVTADFTDGDQVFFESSNPFESGLFGIVNVSFNAVETQFNLQNSDFIAPETGHINNQTTHPSYRVLINIFTALGTLLTPTSLKYVPSQSGELFVDLGTTIAALMQIPDNFSFSLEYFLEITEVWTGSNEAAATTLTLQGVLAKEQLKHEGGSLLWEHLLRAGIPESTTIADFESGLAFASAWTFLNGAWVMDTPVTSTARSDYLVLNQLVLAGTYVMPFTYTAKASGNTSGVVTLSRIIDDGAVGFPTVPLSDTPAKGSVIFTFGVDNNSNFGLTVRPDALDGTIGTFEIHTIDLSAFQRGRFLTEFKNPILWLGWNRTVGVLMDSEYLNRTGGDNFEFQVREADINRENASNNVQSTINDDVGVVILPISQRINENNTAFKKVECRENNVIFTEQLFYEIRSECPQPVMLDFLNASGGVEQHLFTRSQTIELESGAGVNIEIPITTSIENVTRTKQRFAGPSVQRMTLQDNDLTEDQLRALQTLKTTSSLRVYLSKDGLDFIDAIVIRDFITTYRTDTIRHRYRVVIEFPDDFDFFHAVQY